MDPFKIRFKFHFYGDKKTNRIDKPEFYFSFVMNTITEFLPFIQENLPFIKNLNDEFINYLIVLLSERVKKSLDQVKDCSNDQLKQLFIHIINETCSFENSIHEYSKTIQSVVNEIVKDDQVFSQWVIIDKGNIHLDYDWNLYSKHVMITNVTHSFVHLINTLNERYKYLPKEKRITIFGKIEIDIFKEFLSELKKKSKINLGNNTDDWMKYCWILNSSHYCEEYIREIEEILVQVNNNHLYRDYIDEFALLYNNMIRFLIERLFDQFKREYKTSKTLKDILNIGNSISEKLIIISQNTSHHFMIILKKFAIDLDKFLMKENIQDIEILCNCLFEKVSQKPMNLLPQSLKRKL